MLVFQPYVEMLNDNLNGIWNNGDNHIYAALIADGGSAPQRDWTTMSDVLGFGGWSRCSESTDVTLTASQRRWRWNGNASQGSFGPNCIVHGLYDQVDFGIVTQGVSLGAVCVYWDSTNGSNKQDSTNRILWWDDSQVNQAVTSTGGNKWGAGATDNDCVGFQAQTSTTNAYVMGSGMREMQSNVAQWQSGSNFFMRLYGPPPGTPAITGPSSLSTISEVDLNYPRADAQGGGDVPDITLGTSNRLFTWNASSSFWEYRIDPGGSSLSFGLCAAGQALDAVAIYDTNGFLWYWDAAFANVSLVSDTTVTYGPSSEFVAFAYRILSA